ncbi:alpha/beta fold hydrolase [Hanstruepera ponticola]|uniref:alpha/beta fold hydrolase n=1 Tax=Hanstruepera ponticola TaxID=2042995 RepID=UPI00177CEFFD|nr:alpha/beta hydrolase [Hanstruepera ponticola]
MILDYKGIPVFYTDDGLGDVVVLLHGFLENTSMWSKTISHIGHKNRVISIDLLGHGNTGCLGYIHTMEDMAEAVRAVLEHLDIKKAVFIGHSMGGYVALAFADLFPEKVSGICLANSTSQADSDERKINRDRAIKAVKQNHKAFVSMAVTNLFAENNRENLKIEIDSVKNEALKTPLQGIIAALEGMKIRPSRKNILETGNFIKLMLIGTHDTVIQSDSLVSEVKSADIKFIEFEGGHMSYIENEVFFLQEIMHFIDLI